MAGATPTKTLPIHRRRIAQITTSVVEVTCPMCGECQPNPDDGSHQWLPSQVASAEKETICVACDAKLLIVPRGTAKVG